MDLLFHCFFLCFPGHAFVQLHFDLLLNIMLSSLTSPIHRLVALFFDFHASLDNFIGFGSALEANTLASDPSLY